MVQGESLTLICICAIVFQLGSVCTGHQFLHKVTLYILTEEKLMRRHIIGIGICTMFFCAVAFAQYPIYELNFSNDAGVDDYSGKAVAASDGAETLVVGGNSRTDVLERNADGDWERYADALPPGDSVDICFDGSTIVVGKTYTGISGGAYIYDRNDEGTPDDRSDDTWDQVAAFPTEGTSVSISHGFFCNTVVVGDLLEQKARVYKRQNGWAEDTNLQMRGYARVAVDATQGIVVSSDPSTNTVYYRYLGLGNLGELELTGPDGSNFGGGALTFGAIGSYDLIVGATEYPNSDGEPVGACLMYRFNHDTKIYDFDDIIFPPDGEVGTKFCASAGTWYGHPQIIGAPFADRNCPENNLDCNSGVVYIVGRDGIQDERSSGAANDRFGTSVAWARFGPDEGGYHIVGAPRRDNPLDDSGVVFIQRHNPGIFGDGFESGDTCRWTQTCPGGR